VDFKEDQLAIEAYVRMKCGWRDESEISHEEFIVYAFEYMEENPFADDVVKLPTEAIIYDRIGGEFTVWKRVRNTELYWQPGEFWQGMNFSLQALFQNKLHQHQRLLKTLEYLGLVE
jgi:hypothetical protein